MADASSQDVHRSLLELLAVVLVTEERFGSIADFLPLGADITDALGRLDVGLRRRGIELPQQEERYEDEQNEEQSFDGIHGSLLL